MDSFPWPWSFQYSPGIRWEIEPEGIFANSTLRFCKNFECFPATQWTLQYGLMPTAGQISGPITFQSTPLNGGNIFLIDVAPAVTSTWKPGRYTWQCFRQASGTNVDLTQRFFVSTGTIIVSRDLTQPGSQDSRGPWQQIVDVFTAMMLDTAPDTAYEIALGRGMIAGQSIKGWTKEDLIKYHDYALHMAGNEQRIQNARGGAPNPQFKYAVMSGRGNGWAGNGFPDLYPPT